MTKSVVMEMECVKMSSVAVIVTRLHALTHTFVRVHKRTFTLCSYI